MVGSLGAGRIAEYRRALETLSAVDRDLRAEYRARLAALARPAPKEPNDEFQAGAPMRVVTRRDKNGREFDEYRLEDPQTKRALAVTLIPKDGGEGRVSIVSDGKDAAVFTVQFQEKDRDKVPWDLVAGALAELKGGARMRPTP